MNAPVTLQMAFAYRVGRDRKLFDWGALTLVSILNLYTHYMALAATAAQAAEESQFGQA